MKRTHGKTVAISGRSAKSSSETGEAQGETDKRLLKPRHLGIGIQDSISEHEDERLNPGHGEGGGSGAAGDKPKGPSDAA